MPPGITILNFIVLWEHMVVAKMQWWMAQHAICCSPYVYTAAIAMSTRSQKNSGHQDMYM